MKPSSLISFVITCVILFVSCQIHWKAFSYRETDIRLFTLINIFGLLFDVLALLMSYETWAFMTDNQPITSYVVSWVSNNSGISFLLAMTISFISGLLTSHFFWQGKESKNKENKYGL